MSPRNYEKARAVVDAAAADPGLAAVLAEMDRTGNVDRAYRAVKAKRPSGQEKKANKPATKPLAATPAPAPAMSLKAPVTRKQVCNIKRFLRGLCSAETFSDIRATVNTPTCLGLSDAGLDSITLHLRKVRPELVPVMLSLIESLTGSDADRVAGLLRAVLSLRPASRTELLAELREQAERAGRASENGRDGSGR
jgi:hypothetical protein